VWKERKIVKSGVLASFNVEALVFSQFFGRDGAKPL
jgi:hypothetical protein